MEKPYKIDEEYVQPKKTYYIDYYLLDALTSQDTDSILDWLNSHGYDLITIDLNDMYNPIIFMISFILLLRRSIAINDTSDLEVMLPYLPNMKFVLGGVGDIEFINQSIILIHSETEGG